MMTHRLPYHPADEASQRLAAALLFDGLLDPSDTRVRLEALAQVLNDWKHAEPGSIERIVLAREAIRLRLIIAMTGSGSQDVLASIQHAAGPLQALLRVSWAEHGRSAYG